MTMKGIRLAALAVLTLSAGTLPAEDGVLYWMVDSTASVSSDGDDDKTVKDFFNTYEGAAEGSYFAARVRVTGGDISGDTFLSMYYYDEDAGTEVLDPGTLGIGFGDNGSGYWGAGVPDGNQSPVTAFSAGTPEYSFIVELGNVSDGSWTTVATSAASTYSSLSDFIHETFGLNPPSGKVWVPTSFTAVPEPSCGLLIAMGLALLALRREEAKEA